MGSPCSNRRHIRAGVMLRPGRAGSFEICLEETRIRTILWAAAKLILSRSRCPRYGAVKERSAAILNRFGHVVSVPRTCSALRPASLQHLTRYKLVAIHQRERFSLFRREKMISRWPIERRAGHEVGWYPAKLIATIHSILLRHREVFLARMPGSSQQPPQRSSRANLPDPHMVPGS